ncbi:DALR anticodon-binding domain-containing protein [Nocardia asteroides]|uniref:DALR anticodon-binding domain-containing protein n=1 Tax=Nocardia asteroides TaxID=1824 RepID=UPI0037C878C6
MPSLNSNTGFYLQYAHARVCSILRKAGTSTPVAIDANDPLQSAEREYGAAPDEVAEALEPHRLAGYLYELARAYTTFYDSCPVVSAEEPIRSDRIALCQLIARTLQLGLGRLRIAAPQRNVSC